MSQETKNKNEQPKDEAVSEQVPEKELPAEEPKENAENLQEAKAEEAKKEEKPSELDTVKEQLAKEHDGYLRLAAEYDNFRKRSQKEKDDLYTLIKAETVGKFLPVFGEIGEAFDPARHNAVMHVEEEGLGDNVIAEVFQKGFIVGEKVIRFAMVKVAN